MKTVLFLCHGSICRSPAAEAIFRYETKKRGISEEYSASSMALSREEIGNGIYPPMKRALTAAGIPLIEHASQEVTKKELDEADYVFYMDESNRRILTWRFAFAKGVLLSSYIHREEIEDPWYSGRYDVVVSQLKECIAAFLDSLSA